MLDIPKAAATTPTGELTPPKKLHPPRIIVAILLMQYAPAELLSPLFEMAVSMKLPMTIMNPDKL